MKPNRSLDFIRKDTDTPKTQLVMVIGFLALGLIFTSAVFLYVALVIGVICVFVPSAGIRLVWGWYKLADLLGKVTTPLLLGIIYYLFLTPIAWLFRWFGNDPLNLTQHTRSMYELRNHIFTDKDIENPW